MYELNIIQESLDEFRKNINKASSMVDDSIIQLIKNDSSNELSTNLRDSFEYLIENINLLKMFAGADNRYSLDFYIDLGKEIN